MTQSTSPTAPVYHVDAATRLLGLRYLKVEIAAYRDKAPKALPGFVTFFDPGLRILGLRTLRANGKRVFYPQTWYDNEAFAKFQEEPRYRQLQMESAKDSFGKTFAEQQTLVPPGEEIPTARVVLTAMAIHFLATGERLFSGCGVRCVDQTSDSRLVSVGDFDAGGVSVSRWRPDYSGGDLGVVLARKF